MPRVFVGKSYSEATFGFALFIAIVAGVGGSALLLFEFWVGSALLLPVAALSGVVALVRYLDISRNRRWVTPKDDGLTLEDPRGTFDFDDEMISDLGTWSKVRYSNGEPSGMSRTCHLVVRAGELSTNFTFEYRFGLNQIDPLGEFLDRNLERLFEKAWADWTAGRAIDGDGWVLDREGLTHGSGPKQQTLAVHELAAVDIVDGTVSVWAVGQAMPVVKVAAGTPNALILGRLLSKKLEERGKKDEDPADGLGRVIFERDQSWRMATLVLLSLIGMAMSSIGLVGVIDGKSDQLLISTLMIFGGPIIPLIGYFNRKKILRCHTHGVCYITSLKERKLLYKDVRVFTFGATRHYTNGAYTGTAIALTFEPGTEDAGDRIAYSATIQKMDEELDNLRDFVSRVIAQHMLKRLKDNRPVAWTDGLRFLPEGLEIHPSGFFGKKGKWVLPYGEIAGTDMQQGVFYLFQTGRNKHVYEVPVSAANFFPGFVLLNALLAPGDPPPAPSA